VLLYGPCATIRIRTQTLDKSTVLGICGTCMQELYQGRMVLIEQLAMRKLAMVGSIGNDLMSGIIPQRHRAQPSVDALPQFVALNRRIRETGLKTQNCDNGMDRFIRKFDPDTPMSSTIAVVTGHHEEHGCAVYATQESRRCLLLDITHRRPDDKALWTAMAVTRPTTVGTGTAALSERVFTCTREVLGPYPGFKRAS
jgi:hypothetical protein